MRPTSAPASSAPPAWNSCGCSTPRASSPSTTWTTTMSLASIVLAIPPIPTLFGNVIPNAYVVLMSSNSIPLEITSTSSADPNQLLLLDTQLSMAASTYVPSSNPNSIVCVPRSLILIQIFLSVLAIPLFGLYLAAPRLPNGVVRQWCLPTVLLAINLFLLSILLLSSINTACAPLL